MVNSTYTCPVCRGRSFHDNEEGFMACERCGAVVESAGGREEAEYDPFVFASSNLSSKRNVLKSEDEEKIVEKAPKSIEDLVDDSRLILACFQSILSAHARAMVDSFGFPSEVLKSIGRIWICMLDDWVERGWGSEVPSVVHTLNKRSRLSNDSFDLVYNEQSVRFLLVTSRPSRYVVKHIRVGVLNSGCILAICFLSCVYFRVPFSAREILLLASTGKLPFLASFQTIPEELQEKLKESNIQLHSMMFPEVPTLDDLQFFVFVVLAHVGEKLGIKFKLADMLGSPLDCVKACSIMSLPREIAVVASNVKQLTMKGFMTVKANKKFRKLTKVAEMGDHLTYMSILFALKLIYGLDGTEYDLETHESTRGFPELKDLLTNLKPIADYDPLFVRTRYGVSQSPSMVSYEELLRSMDILSASHEKASVQFASDPMRQGLLDDLNDFQELIHRTTDQELSFIKRDTVRPVSSMIRLKREQMDTPPWTRFKKPNVQSVTGNNFVLPLEMEMILAHCRAITGMTPVEAFRSLNMIFDYCFKAISTNTPQKRKRSSS